MDHDKLEDFASDTGDELMEKVEEKTSNRDEQKEILEMIDDEIRFRLTHWDD